MPKLTIDGRRVEVPGGQSVLEAARSLGIYIPSLCYLQGFECSTSCMACVVRIDGRSALVPSCATPATEGMQVESETEEVRAARRTALDLLVSDHAGDCVAPCQRADSLHIDVPRFLRQVQAGDLNSAAATLALAGVDLSDPDSIDLSRAEKACRRGRYDQTVAIEDLARHVARQQRRESGAPAQTPSYREFTVRIAGLSETELEGLLTGATPGGQVEQAAPESGFAEEEARLEASRCQHCDCRMADICTLRDACEAHDVQTGRFRSSRPDLEIDRSHPDIYFEHGKCILCGLCVQVAERAGEPVGLALVGRGFDMRLRTPFDVPLSEALIYSAGACADVCPTGALARKAPE